MRLRSFSLSKCLLRVSQIKFALRGFKLQSTQKTIFKITFLLSFIIPRRLVWLTKTFCLSLAESLHKYINVLIIAPQKALIPKTQTGTRLHPSNDCVVEINVLVYSKFNVNCFVKLMLMYYVSIYCFSVEHSPVLIYVQQVLLYSSFCILT